jgi:ATP-dependent Clp protease, protease subunit
MKKKHWESPIYKQEKKVKTNKKVTLIAALFMGVLLLPTSSSTKSATDSQVTLSKSNTVVLSGIIDGESAGPVITRAKELGSRSSKPLYLFLNTPGGSIQTGLEMIESLKGLGRPVSTVTLFAASMGFQVIQNLGERLVLKNGILMSHRASGEFSGSFGGQRPSQMDNRYNMWLSRLTELDEAVVERSNGKQTLESYQKAYANELWLTGSQAVSGGYADRIVTVRCDSSLNGVTTHTVQMFGLNVSYDLDNCPLNTSPMNIRISSDDKQEVSGEKVAETKAKFTSQYIHKHTDVVPMRIPSDLAPTRE